jgi:prevent-host-death family protein
MYNTYMSLEVPVSEARANLGPLTSRVTYGGETVYLTKHGQRAVAMVPVAAAELLEEIELVVDLEAVRAVRDRLAQGTETSVPFSRRTPRAS